MSTFDFDAYTQTVIDSIGANAPKRVKEVFPVLIKHLHAFLIEADITSEELIAGCDLLVRAGQVSSDKRNEVLLCTDVFGVEALVDTIDQTRNARLGRQTVAEDTTDSAILGPFYRKGVPVQENGTSIIRTDEVGPYTHLHGIVYDADGKPLPNAEVDIWHDAPDGLYDSQTPEKPEYHCRGRFRTDENGRYSTICLKPTPYPIPYDHSAGDLLQLLDRSPYRPAHIHFWIEHPEHRTLVTQVFNSDSHYLKNDSVFAVKEKLIVDFKPIPPDFKPPPELEGKMVYELVQNFRLQRP